jgi:hypothetical protein
VSTSQLAAGVQAELLPLEELPDDFFITEREDGKPARPRYTARLFFRRRPQEYQRTVELLAAGLDLREVSRMMRVHHRTVAAVREAEGSRIDTYKQRVISNLRSAVEVLSGALSDSVASLPARDQPVAFGILVDKLQLLEGEPTSRTEHVLEVRLTHDAVARAIAALPVETGCGHLAEPQKSGAQALPGPAGEAPGSDSESDGSMPK